MEKKDIIEKKDLMTIKQAAEFLGVAPNTLRNWEKSNSIQVQRHPISRYRLYKKEDLEAILKAIQ